MLKMKSVLSVQVNGKDYEFSCSPDSPLQEALDANNQVNAFLLGRMQQAKEAQKPAEQVEEQPKSE